MFKKLLPILLSLIILSGCSGIQQKGYYSNINKSYPNKNNDKENSSLLDLKKNICKKDSDCLQWVLCGCNTREYASSKLKESEEKGIMYDVCVEPKDSYCICENNKCIQLINENKR